MGLQAPSFWVNAGQPPSTRLPAQILIGAPSGHASRLWPRYKFGQDFEPCTTTDTADTAAVFLPTVRPAPPTIMTSSTTKINRRVASEFLGPRAYKMSVKDIKLAASRLPCKFRRKFIPDPPLRPKPHAPEPLSTEPSPVPHNVPPRFRRKPWLALPAPAQCALTIRVPSMEHRIASLSSEVALLRQKSQLPDGAEKKIATRRKPARSRAARSSASKTGKENTLGDRRQATIEQGVITRSRAAAISSARRARGAGSRRR